MRARVWSRRSVEPGQAISLRQVAKLKGTLLRMRLPGKLMFLFRFRIGLHAVLARLGAKLDWIELEEELASFPGAGVRAHEAWS